MNTEKCTGCRLCEKVCPKQAIKMESKWFGFLYPQVYEEKCIHCNLCDKVCPTNNIQQTNIIDSFVGYTQDKIREKESSGGIFSQIAKYVLKKHGVVFGAVFDKNWNVIITYTDNDITPMLGSKYVQADIKNTYQECKDFLEQGKLVLYTGTPCQIYGLKGFLKKDYDNLITLDIFCHGVPSPKAWQNYIKSFNKEIKSINFRDKRNSWENFNLTIKFKDGTELSEGNYENKYMRLFLQNKILRKSCYDCKLRCNSIADISIGDAWAIQTKINDYHGLSDIVIHTEKGKFILEHLDLVKENITYNNILKTNCINIKHSIPNDRIRYLKLFDAPKIGIVSIPSEKNIGNILQSFALQSKIKELVPYAETVEALNQKPYLETLEFQKKYIKSVSNGYNDTYSMLIVGSDQIWIPNLWPGVIPTEDQFLLHKNILKRIVYAASFGKHTWNFPLDLTKRIYDTLKNEKYISTRELSGEFLTKHWFNINAKPVLDPTMLYDKEFYLNTLKLSEETKTKGIFVYVLDKNNEWNKKINELSKKLNEPILKYDESVENFISNFNKAKYVITDSYHGSVFSIIFNKPFACLRNKNRGNDRFDDLALRFNLDNCFVESLNDIQNFNEPPNCHNMILQYRKDSLDFLIAALYSL